MNQPIDEETKKHLSRFVDCGTAFINDDEDEITAARSIMDEIIEETESPDDQADAGQLFHDKSRAGSKPS